MSESLQTVIVLIFAAAAAAWLLRGLWRSMAGGKSSCGCGKATACGDIMSKMQKARKRQQKESPR